MTSELTPRPAGNPAVPYSGTSPAYPMPETPLVRNRTYASPMSYVGSFRRTTAWIRRVGDSAGLAALAWVVGACWIAFMWFMVLPAWYLVTIVVFGIFTIPWRFLRRSQRKQVHLQGAQLATMQAMLQQQQRLLDERDRG